MQLQPSSALAALLKMQDVQKYAFVTGRSLVPVHQNQLYSHRSKRYDIIEKYALSTKSWAIVISICCTSLLESIMLSGFSYKEGLCSSSGGHHEVESEKEKNLLGCKKQ